MMGSCLSAICADRDREQRLTRCRLLLVAFPEPNPDRACRRLSRALRDPRRWHEVALTVPVALIAALARLPALGHVAGRRCGALMLLLADAALGAWRRRNPGARGADGAWPPRRSTR